MLSEPTIISFDTTGFRDSIALYHKEEVLCKILPQGGSALQSSLLVPSLYTLLQKKNLSFQDINIITTLSGPGSFTGIRIGLATAQGLILAGGYQPIVPTLLEVLAFAAYQRDPSLTKVTSIVDSKRGDFFSQHFDANLSPLEEAKTLDIDHVPGNTFLISDKPIEGLQTFTPQKTIAEILIEFCLRHALTQKNRAYTDLDPFYIRTPEFTKKKRFIEI